MEYEMLLEASLSYIAEECYRVYWNIHQEQLPLPTGNNGTEYKTDVFHIRSYDWGADLEGEDPMPYNFKWRDIEIRWYKWCGRGMECNKQLTPDIINEMLEDCVKSIQKDDV